ncbi:hypothetical protein SHKM778_59730 [Streptomyces sp. KM77-8]|uniref:GNAT family N-acetyltransferase n=1 Tax=Streptomyces haneummycinicus TaxID=3074435 RepID=A0AAT9HPQ6_9ACTN
MGGHGGPVREGPRRRVRGAGLPLGDVDPWNLRTVLLRTEREEIPEPWARLSALADVAWLWEVQGTGRWVAVAVAHRDPGDAVRLLAVVTETAPP